MRGVVLASLRQPGSSAWASPPDPEESCPRRAARTAMTSARRRSWPDRPQAPTPSTRSDLRVT